MEKMTKEEVVDYVYGYVIANPGCLAVEIAQALHEDQVGDPIHGKYNRVAWAINGLRSEGKLVDDMPKCSECKRILNRAPRPLYASLEESSGI